MYLYILCIYWDVIAKFKDYKKNIFALASWNVMYVILKMHATSNYLELKFRSKNWNF